MFLTLPSAPSISALSRWPKTHEVSLRLMPHLLATKLYSKVGLYIGLIPGSHSLILDTPLVQMVVHNISSTFELPSLQKELTTFN